MAPELTLELLDLVKRMEGFRATPYLCPAGYPTIGYGHRIPSLQHPPITEAEAEQLLRVDLGWAQRAALQLAPNLVTEPRRLAALTDLAYNVGRDALDGMDPNDLGDDAGVVQCLRAGDWTGAAVRFRRWNKARVHGR
ncbi:MAG: lysozyme [Gemmatimonadetes bacterium]|nr:lysozyme [Gemmatimonadota bacterium]